MDRKKIPTDKRLSRRIEAVDLTRADDESRTVEAALSSEKPVKRWFGNEILSHERSAINFDRAGEGLPLLWSHNSDQVIGRVENVRVDSDRKLRGTLRFSPNSERGREVYDDVKDGFLRDVSIGYSIDHYEEDESNESVTVTRWTPLEASLVAVPADPQAGVNRNYDEGQTMAKDERPEGPENVPVTAAGLKIVRERNLTEGANRGMREERERIRLIRDLFSKYDQSGAEYRDLEDMCIDQGVSLTEATRQLLELVSETMGVGEPSDTILRQRPGSMIQRNEPQFQPRQGFRQQRVEVTQDSHDAWKESAELVLMTRTGLATPEEREKAKGTALQGMTMPEMARSYLTSINSNLSGLDRVAIVGQALVRSVGHSSSDFANLLSNVANKALQVGYTEAEESWSAWCSVGSTNDFKIFERANLTGFDDLVTITESEEYKYGGFLDQKEQAQLVTYGRLFSISRQALINDDLGKLGTVPRAMGRAAARKVGDLAYSVLTTNAAMADGTTLFHADHSNYNASGVAITAASVGAVRAAMAKQTDAKSNVLNIRPAYLVCPVAIEQVARVLQTSQNDPGASVANIPNPVSGTFTTVSDARLDADDANDWYMIAAPSSVSTVEVTFLEGNQTPYLEERDGWSVDGVEYKVRIDAVAKALDWRGMYLQAGA